jgi:hypothetical protein
MDAASLTVWREVGPGADEDVVLAVDFGTGRGGASFADLAVNLAPGHRVLLTVPPAPESSKEIPGESGRYASRLIEDLLATGVSVRAVLGYCAGADLAGVVCDVLAGAGHFRPRLVTLDPEPAGVGTLHEEFQLAVEPLSAHLPADDVVATLNGAADATAVAEASRLSALALVLSQYYRQLVPSFIERRRLPTRLGGELCRRFDSYVAYLVACGEASRRGRAAADLSIISNQHAGGGEARHMLRFQARRSELLSSPQVAATVAELIS